MPSFPDQPLPPRPLLPAAADEPPRLTARTLDGLEWVLAAELESVGATDLRVGRRTIEFSGNTETLYRSVLESRTAIRVLEPLGRFAVDSPESLYRAVATIDWPVQPKPPQCARHSQTSMFADNQTFRTCRRRHIFGGRWIICG